MSKQHHFTVWHDTQTKKWDVGYARFDEDMPVFDTKKEEWLHLTSIEDINRDGELLDELRRRLDSEPLETKVEREFR